MTKIIKAAEIGHSIIAISQDKYSMCYIVTLNESEGYYFKQTSRRAYGTLKQAQARYNHLLRRITP